MPRHTPGSRTMPVLVVAIAGARVLTRFVLDDRSMAIQRVV